MKYHYRATQTDPLCLNEAGNALVEKKEHLDWMKNKALELANLCVLAGLKHWSNQLGDLALELAYDVMEIEEELSDDLVD